MPGTERLGAGEHHRRVLALVADPRALAVVERCLAESLLRHLLEPALEVLVLGRGGQRPVSVEVVVVGGVVAGVQEHGSQHCLECIREQRLQIAPAAFGDALAEIQVAAEVELLGHLSERVGVDHRGARLCQLPFRCAGVVLVQVLGGDQLEHGIAEIFEAFVVARRLMRAFVGEGAVGDRLE